MNILIWYSSEANHIQCKYTFILQLSKNTLDLNRQRRGRRSPRSNTFAYWIIPGNSRIQYLMGTLLSFPLHEYLKLQVPSQLLNSSIFPDNILLVKKKSKPIQRDLSHRIPNDINGSNLPIQSLFFLNFRGGFKCNFLKPHNVFCFLLFSLSEAHSDLIFPLGKFLYR